MEHETTGESDWSPQLRLCGVETLRLPLLCLRRSQASFWQPELKDRNSLDGDEERQAQLALLSPFILSDDTRSHLLVFLYAH